ncbi:MAG: hypothetical protein K6A73_02560 [Bacteroidales bacterium]|nr:hypothetical protein [Bacteroidales bacterium]
MKRVTYLLSIVLLLGMTQCKKNNVAPTASTNGPHITLNVSYGNGAKTEFIPGSTSFVWTNGATEYLYVGGSAHPGCLGVLSGTGNSTSTMTFGGDLTTTPSENETLYFFYLGKGQTGTAVTSLDFSKQDGTLANVTNYHVAISEGIAYTGQSDFNTTLNMAMAIAYFDMSGFVSSSNEAETVYLHGEDVYTTATIDYQHGTIAGGTKGLMKIGTASAGAYVALLPSGNTNETWLYFDSNSNEGQMKFLRGIQPAKYYAHSGAALNVTADAVLEGSLPGLFSVSATQRVRFSQGNLKYHCSLENPEWRFAENQYEHVLYNADNYGENTGSWIYNFGWGTSGYGHRNLYYQPWSNGGGYNDYTAYNDNNKSLYEEDGTADWGYNAISNGGNTKNIGWRTLTGDEWQYLMFTRPTSTVAGRDNARFAKAYLFETKLGVIVFPDNYTHPEGVASPININVTNSDAYSNRYSLEDWLKMEAAGCVFLTHTETSKDANKKDVFWGIYWSSQYQDYAGALCLIWNRYSSSTGISRGSSLKHSRNAVRLVRNR